MNDLQIQYFLTLSKNLSFTKTAQVFCVTQPAVSKQIAVLEKELGVALSGIDDIECFKLVDIPKILLYSKKHPLSVRKKLMPQDFKDEIFFVMSPDEGSYAKRLVREYCMPYGFEPKIQCVRNIESMNICVQNGLGVSINDYWSRGKDNADFNYIELNEKHEIALAWLKEKTSDEIAILAEEMKILLNKDKTP